MIHSELVSVHCEVGLHLLSAHGCPVVRKDGLSLLNCSGVLAKNQLTINAWVYFWIFNSISLIHTHSYMIPAPKSLTFLYHWSQSPKVWLWFFFFFLNLQISYTSWRRSQAPFPIFFPLLPTSTTSYHHLSLDLPETSLPCSHFFSAHLSICMVSLCF